MMKNVIKSKQLIKYILSFELWFIKKEHIIFTATRPQENAELKRAFRSALDNLPRSALKTELQKNAATYFRKLEA